MTVFDDVLAERAKQDEKWGEQNHPDADQTILARRERGDQYADPASIARRLAEEYEIPTAARAKFACQEKARQGRVTWFDILLEEVAELLEAIAAGDLEAIRDEVIDVTAVGHVWAEALDRRRWETVTRA